MQTDTVSKIVQRLNPVVSKRLGVVLNVYGEPGIGKSWTVTQVLKTIPCQTLSLAANIKETDLAAALPRPKKLPVWAEKQLAHLEQGKFIDSPALVNTLTALLAGLAPFVLQLEDVHEVTSERLALIQKLAVAVKRNKGIGLVVTSRSELGEPFQGFRVESLGQTESETFLISELGAALPTEGFQYIYAQSHGNPLFMLEFLRYLTRQGFLWSDSKNWRWRFPPEHFVPISLEAIIGDLISSAQTQDLKATMQARSMLPSKLKKDQVFSAWAQMAGITTDVLLNCCRFLERQGIFYQNNFTHPLIAQTVKRDILPPDRQKYAQRAFQAFQSDLELAVLFVQDAVVDKAQAFELIQRLINSSQEQGNKLQEVELKSLVCVYCPDQQRLEFNLEAAKLMLSVNVGKAIEHAEVAVQIAPDNENALRLAAEVWAYERRTDRIEFFLSQIPVQFKASKDWFEYLVRLKTLTGNYSDVVNIWTDHLSNGSEVETLTLNRVTTAYANLGQFIDAQKLLVDALERTNLALIPKANLLGLLGFVQGALGNYTVALNCYSEGYALLQEAGSDINIASNLLNKSSILAVLGQFEQAIVDLGQAIRLFSGQGLKTPTAVAQSRLGEYQTELGQFEQAEKHLLESLHELGQISPSPYLIDCHHLLCELYMHWNPPYAKALVQRFSTSALKHAQAIGGDKVMTEALKNASVIESWLDNPKQGLAYAEQALKIAQTLDSPARVHAALRAQIIAQAKLGHLEDAQSLFAKLPKHNQEERFVLETHKVGLLLDAVMGDSESAKERVDWLIQKGFFGTVSVAQRYFPELNAQPVVHLATIDTKLFLKVLGTVSLERQGKPINYRGRKRLEFLGYLLETRISGRLEAPTLEIIDALYPELLEPEAKSALKQLVYLLRSKLGSDVIQSTSQGYALGTITSDAEEFLATGDPVLWHGVYLEGLSEGWLPGVRDALVQAIRQKIESLAKTDTKQAARLGQILLEMEPYDRDTLELTLRAIGTNEALSGSLYRSAKIRFEQIGESLPNSSEAFLRMREESFLVD